MYCSATSSRCSPKPTSVSPDIVKDVRDGKIIAVKNAKVDTFRDRWAPFIESGNVLVL